MILLLKQLTVETLIVNGNTIRQIFQLFWDFSIINNNQLKGHSLHACKMHMNDYDTAHNAKALIYDSHEHLFYTVTRLIRSYVNAAQDNVKLTCKRSGPLYFDIVWFIVSACSEEVSRVLRLTITNGEKSISY